MKVKDFITTFCKCIQLDDPYGILINDREIALKLYDNSLDFEDADSGDVIATLWDDGVISIYDSEFGEQIIN